MSDSLEPKPPEPTAQTDALPAYRSKPQRTFCIRCGQSLSELPVEGACPSCGDPYRQVVSEEKVPDGFLCYKCGYGLVGLPADGECPECSTPYALSLAFRGKPHPGQMPLVVRLFWPVALGCFAGAGLLISSLAGGFSRDFDGFLGLCLLGAVLANLINVPISSSSISARYVPPHRRKRWSANMFFLGPWVGTAWVIATVAAVITVAAPVLAFGACMLGGRW